MSIWVCGEVLIDILPSGPVVGGGPANTAKALALNVSGLGCVGMLIISGLPQVEDHLFAVEVVTEFLARKGEEQ